jgi:hypothetical protein
MFQQMGMQVYLPCFQKDILLLLVLGILLEPLITPNLDKYIIPLYCATCTEAF